MSVVPHPVYSQLTPLPDDMSGSSPTSDGGVRGSKGVRGWFRLGGLPATRRLIAGVMVSGLVVCMVPVAANADEGGSAATTAQHSGSVAASVSSLGNTGASSVFSSNKGPLSARSAFRFSVATVAWFVTRDGQSYESSDLKARVSYFASSTNEEPTHVEDISPIGFNPYLGHTYRAAPRSFEKYMTLQLVDPQGIPFGLVQTVSVNDFPPDVEDLAYSTSGAITHLTATLRAAGPSPIAPVEFFVQEPDGTLRSLGVTQSVPYESGQTRSSVSLSTTGLGVGTHTLVAKSLLNGHLTESRLSDALEITLEAEYSAQLVSDPVTYGESANLTVNVADQFGTPAPSGSILISIGDTSQLVTLENGSATLTVPGLPAGTHPWTARLLLEGQDSEQPSESSVEVLKAPSTLNAPASVEFPSNGSNVSLLATVRGLPAPGELDEPTGLVTVEYDGEAVASTALSVSGDVNFDLAPFAQSAGTFVVSYHGDNNYESVSREVSFTTALPEEVPPIEPEPEQPEPEQPEPEQPEPEVPSVQEPEPQPIPPVEPAPEPAAPEVTDELAITGAKSWPLAITASVLLALGAALSGVVAHLQSSRDRSRSTR